MVLLLWSLMVTNNLARTTTAITRTQTLVVVVVVVVYRIGEWNNAFELTPSPSIGQDKQHDITLIIY